jgi:hypothetical protein
MPFVGRNSKKVEKVEEAETASAETATETVSA